MSKGRRAVPMIKDKCRIKTSVDDVVDVGGDDDDDIEDVDELGFDRDDSS